MVLFEVYGKILCVCVCVYVCVFLGAKAPLGPLQFVKVKVKVKRKSFKIEYVAGLPIKQVCRYASM